MLAAMAPPPIAAACTCSRDALAIRRNQPAPRSARPSLLARRRRCIATGDVTRDEHVANIQHAPKFAEQVQYLHLRRGVHRRDRLVADDRLRLHHGRAAVGDAQALTTGELVRLTQQCDLAQSHLIYQALQPRAALSVLQVGLQRGQAFIQDVVAVLTG